MYSLLIDIRHAYDSTPHGQWQVKPRFAKYAKICQGQFYQDIFDVNHNIKYIFLNEGSAALFRLMFNVDWSHFEKIPEKSG